MTFCGSSLICVCNSKFNAYVILLLLFLFYEGIGVVTSGQQEDSILIVSYLFIIINFQLILLNLKACKHLKMLLNWLGAQRVPIYIPTILINLYILYLYDSLL